MTLCIPITARIVSEALQDIEEANSFADWIELRLDYLQDATLDTIAQLVQACQKQVIATHRDIDPIPLLKSALDAGADLVDVQEITKEIPPERCILSLHLDKTPSLFALLELYNKMQNKEPAIIKIVTFANTFLDNLTILQFLEKVPKNKVIAFCMGEKGALSRYYAPAYGSVCTFGMLKSGKESASGQPLASHLKEHLPNKRTTLYAVIGDPIAHSISPAIHQASYDAERKNSLFLPFHVKAEELQEIISLVRKFPLKGLAVTIPHKETVISFLDSVDLEAKKIGAVNTIVNDNGHLKGYNTDLDGAMTPLKKCMHLSGKKAVILGYGGAAKAFIYGLEKEGVDVTVLGRSTEKLNELSCKTGSLGLLKKILPSFDLLIQTTPVGMSPHRKETLVPSEWIHSGLIVFDCVYNPLETQLIKDAKKSGCQTISGLEMFLTQAHRQYELFTELSASKIVMRKTALETIII